MKSVIEIHSLDRERERERERERDDTESLWEREAEKVKERYWERDKEFSKNTINDE